MIQTRYSQPFSQSFSDLSARKNKLLSTGFSNSKNSMNTTMQLPRLNRSLSSTSAKSAKERMTTITERLDTIKSKTDELRMDTRQSRRFVNFLKDDLAERQLNEHKSKLSLQIKKLQNAFKFQRKQNQDRTAAIYQDCKQLSANSKCIIQMVEDLKIRVDNLQQTMGIYSGKQKHRF